MAHCNQLGLSEPLKLILGITAGADFVSLVTLCNNCPIQRHRHMGNNDSGIWETTLLVYGQQQHRDMTNNRSVIWVTTLSAYDKQRQRDMTNNGAGICGKAHKGMLRMIPILTSTPVLLKTILILTGGNENDSRYTPPAGPYTTLAGSYTPLAGSLQYASSRACFCHLASITSRQSLSILKNAN